MVMVIRHLVHYLSVYVLLIPALASAFTAYNDLAWDTGQREHNITMITSPNGGSGLLSQGELIDFDTGRPTGITLTVTGGKFDPSSHISRSGRAEEGDAEDIFQGKVSTLGSISDQELPPPEGNLVLTFSGLRQDARYTLVFYGHRSDYGWNRGSTVELSNAASFTNSSSIGSDDNNRSLFSSPIDASTRLPAGNDDGWVARFTGIDPGEDGVVALTIASAGSSSSAQHQYQGKYANDVMLQEIRNFTAYNDLAWAPGQLEHHITMITSSRPRRNSHGLPSQGSLVDHITGRSTLATLKIEEGFFAGERHIENSGSPAPGTEAFAIFDGKVSARGSISYPNPDGEDDLLLEFSDLQPNKRYELVFYSHRDRHGWYRASLAELLGAKFFRNTSSQGLDDRGEPLFSGPGDLSTRLPADNDQGWVARFTNIYPGRDGEVTLRVRWFGTRTPDRDDGFRGKYANALSLRQSDPLPFTVDTPADALDIDPGDGICATSTGACTLRAAVQEANVLKGFDHIHIPSGMYAIAILGPDEDDATSGDLDITDDLAVTGAGLEQTLIDGAEHDRLFHIHPGSTVRMQGLTLQHGAAAEGGAIRNHGRITLIHTRVRNNLAMGNAQGEAGGGIYNHVGSTLLILNSQVIHNTAGQDNTSARCDGGGIYNQGHARLIKTLVSDNAAGVRNDAAEGCMGAGGGLYNRWQLELTDAEINHNAASEMGGGIASIGGIVDVRNSVVADNRSWAEAGGLGFVGSTATLLESIVTRNASEGASGGGIDNDRGSLLTITQSTISANTVADNDAGGSGGGIHNHLSQLTVHRSTISHNTAAGHGGGLMNAAGLAIITNSTFSKNTAQGLAPAAGDGGAIWTSYSLRIINNTISANHAARNGGGIDGPIELVNSIVDANSAGAAGPDCHGGVRSAGHNLIGDPNGCTDSLQASDLTGQAGLGAYMDDGTPGGGHFPLLPDSRAIDAAAEDACSPLDQLARPRTEICDMGSVEFFEP